MTRLMYVIGATTLLAVAALSTMPSSAAIGPDSDAGSEQATGRLDVAQTATPCRGGYRLIQLVESGGEPAHGVLVRCNG